MTVRSSAASAPLKSRNCCVMIGWPLSFSAVSDHTTSCAVSGVPSWNLASARKEKRWVSPSSEIRTLFAASPYIASGSSPERAIRAAKVKSIPNAPSPLRM